MLATLPALLCRLAGLRPILDSAIFRIALLVREIIRLKFSAGISTREIARRLGIAASTVRETLRCFDASSFLVSERRRTLLRTTALAVISLSFVVSAVSLTSSASDAQVSGAGGKVEPRNGRSAAPTGGGTIPATGTTSVGVGGRELPVILEIQWALTPRRATPARAAAPARRPSASPALNATYTGGNGGNGADGVGSSAPGGGGGGGYDIGFGGTGSHRQRRGQGRQRRRDYGRYLTLYKSFNGYSI